MAYRDEFMEAVAVIKAEDDQLRDALIRSETQVKESVGRMQSQFNTLSLGAGAASGGVGRLSASIGTAGQTVQRMAPAMSLLGGQIGGLASVVGGLAAAFSSFAGIATIAVVAVGYAMRKLTDHYKEAAKAAEEFAQKQAQLADAYVAQRKAEKDAALKSWETVGSLIKEEQMLRAQAHGEEAVALTKYYQRFDTLNARIQELRSRGVMPGSDAGRTVYAEIDAIERLKVSLGKSTENELADIRERSRQQEIAAEREKYNAFKQMDREYAEAWKQTAMGRIQTAFKGIVDRERLKSEMGGLLAMMQQAIPGMGPMLDMVKNQLGIGAAVKPVLSPAGPRGAGIDPYQWIGGPTVTGGDNEQLRLARQQVKHLGDISQKLNPNPAAGGARP